MSDSVDDIAKDTVIGCEAIGAYIGSDPRRVHYMASRGQLPGAFRLGRSWALLKSVYAAEIRARATRTAQSA